MNTIDVGLAAATLQPSGAVQTSFSQALQTLNSQIAAYQASQQQAVAQIQNEARTNGLAADTSSQINYDLTQSTFYANQIAGFRASYDANSASLGGFTTAYNGLTAGDSVDSSVGRRGRTRCPRPCRRERGGSGRDDPPRSPRRSQGPGWTDPWSPTGTYIVANAGTILNISTSGYRGLRRARSRAWAYPIPVEMAPTCRSRTRRRLVNQGQGYFFTTSGSATNSTVTATGSSNATQNATSKTENASLCANATIGSPNWFGSSTSFTASACLSASKSSTTTSSNTTSTDTQNGTNGALSASFSEGVRIPGTPFPTSPAGALLVVQVDPTTGGLIDATSVQPGNVAVLIKKNANV